MNLVDQPTNAPSRKLSAAILAGALVALARWAVPALNDDALWIGLTPLVIWAVGYLVRDKDNTPEPKEPVRGI